MGDDREVAAYEAPKPKANEREECGVCGTGVVPSTKNDDRRRGPEGWMRCFEHIGQEVPPRRLRGLYG